LKPALPGHAIGDYHQQAETQSKQGKSADQAIGLFLKCCALGLDLLQSLSNLAHLSVHSRGHSYSHPPALHHQAAGVDERQIISAGPGHDGRLFQALGANFSHRGRLAGKQRFVGGEVGAVEQDGIGRHAVSFSQDDQVSRDHIPSCDPFLHTVPDDQGPGAGEVSQGV